MWKKIAVIIPVLLIWSAVLAQSLGGGGWYGFLESLSADLGGSVISDSTGNVTINDNLDVSADTDASVTLGRTLINSRSSDISYVSHVDASGNSDFALAQTAAGATKLNAKSGQVVQLLVANTEIFRASSTGVGIGNVSPSYKLQVQSAASGGAAASASADELVLDNSGDTGMTLRSGNTSTGYVAFGDDANSAAGFFAYYHNGDYMTLNAGAKEIARFAPAGLRVEPNGVGGAATAALHVDQAATDGAKPVLLVDQADVDQDLIKFVGESTTDATQSLVDAADLTTPGSVVGWLKIYIEDVQATNPITDGVYYVPFYSAPTP